jgi:hypothetical protein
VRISSGDSAAEMLSSPSSYDVIWRRKRRKIPKRFLRRSYTCQQGAETSCSVPFFASTGSPYLGTSGATVWHAVSGAVTTRRPARLLPSLVDFARSHGLEIWLEVEHENRMVAAIGRIARDLAIGRR